MTGSSSPPDSMPAKSNGQATSDLPSLTGSRPHLEPASQDLGAHLQDPPGASSQAAALADLQPSEHPPRATRSLLGASQETLACQSEGVPPAAAINPSTAIRAVSRKRPADVASEQEKWAADTLEALKSGPAGQALRQPLSQGLLIAPLSRSPGAGSREYPEDANATLANQSVLPMISGIPAPMLNLNLNLSDLLQASLHPRMLQPAIRGAPEPYYNSYPDDSDPDMMPIRTAPRHRGTVGTGLSKPEHANSVAKRRGPMDEMRQLMRILVQVIPAAADYVGGGDEGTSNNKVKERDIHLFLRRILGSGPYPEWGLPEGSQHVGWGGYLSDLFSWATGREITKEQAMQCACRQQGRRWEARYDKLQELGVYSYNWVVPLNQQQTMNAMSEIPVHLMREERQEHHAQEQMAEAVLNAAGAVYGPAATAVGLASPAVGLGANGRKSAPKAKRQRAAPASAAGPEAPLSPEEQTRLFQLPQIEKWKLLTLLMRNMSDQIEKNITTKPEKDLQWEEVIADKAWEQLDTMRKQRNAACQVQDTPVTSAAAVAAAAAAAAGAGRKVAVPVLMANQLASMGQPVFTLPTMLQGGQGMQMLPQQEVLQQLLQQAAANAGMNGEQQQALDAFTLAAQRAAGGKPLRGRALDALERPTALRGGLDMAGAAAAPLMSGSGAAGHGSFQNWQELPQAAAGEGGDDSDTEAEEPSRHAGSNGVLGEPQGGTPPRGMSGGGLAASLSPSGRPSDQLRKELHSKIDQV